MYDILSKNNLKKEIKGLRSTRNKFKKELNALTKVLLDIDSSNIQDEEYCFQQIEDLIKQIMKYNGN